MNKTVTKKTILHLLFSVVLGAIGLVLAFALMLRFHTTPPIAFAYLLFFTTLRSILVVSLSRERLIQFGAASLLCIAAAFWVLGSNAPMVWDRHDGGIYSVLWRSAIILLCILAIPRGASLLAGRSVRHRRLPVT